MAGDILLNIADLSTFSTNGLFKDYRDMKREELLARISIDPNFCFGKPCIRGHRIWVSLILDFLAGGMTVQEILKEYPGLEEADVLACIA